MGKWDKFFKKNWERNKKWDPLTHRALEVVVRQDSKNVRELSKLNEKILPGKLGEWSGDLADEADKNVDDPARGIGRAALTAGAIYGAAAAAGAAGAGGGAAAGATGGTGLSATGGSGLTLAGTSGTGAGLSATGGSGLTLAGTTGTGAGISSAGGGGIGAGIGSSIPAGSALSSGGSSSGLSNFQKYNQARSLGDSLGNAMGRQQPQQEVTRADEGNDEWSEDLQSFAEMLQREGMATSTKRAKVPRSRGLHEAVSRGLSGEDPISANGVQIAGIQALLARAKKAEQRIEALKRKGKL